MPVSRLSPFMRRVPPPFLSQEPEGPPPRMSASMTSSASPAPRLRLRLTVIVRCAFCMFTAAPLVPEMKAAWVPPLCCALAVMVLPMVSTPPEPRSTPAWELTVEAPP